MKIFKGFSIFLLTLVLLESCFEPPEFPAAPQLTFDRVEFIDGPSTDSLVIYLTFRDGDGDLGIDANDLDYISYPFHSQYYYQDNGAGGLDSLATFAASSESGAEYHIIDIPKPKQGKLIFERTRKLPGFGYLPEMNCRDYEALSPFSNVLIDSADIHALDEIAINNIIDTLRGGGTLFYQLRDTLYRSTNLNHYNLEVRFYTFDDAEPDPNKRWKEFDWGDPPYCQPFHMRFPFLTDTPGQGLEGTLRYAMPSLGWNPLFSIKRLNIKVRIKDRNLNVSNWVESGEFTLAEKTVN